MEPLKNFSQSVIEQTIAQALSKLTGERYTAEIKSKELLDLSLWERNTIAFARASRRGLDAVTQKEKIVLVLNTHLDINDENEVVAV